jgi:hypothetical protein
MIEGGKDKRFGGDRFRGGRAMTLALARTATRAALAILKLNQNTC